MTESEMLDKMRKIEQAMFLLINTREDLSHD